MFNLCSRMDRKANIQCNVSNMNNGTNNRIGGIQDGALNIQSTLSNRQVGNHDQIGGNQTGFGHIQSHMSNTQRGNHNQIGGRQTGVGHLQSFTSNSQQGNPDRMGGRQTGVGHLQIYTSKMDGNQEGGSENLLKAKKENINMCVASRDSDFLEIVANRVEEMFKSVKVSKELITKGAKEKYKKNFDGNPLLLLVALVEPRMLLVSEKEESSLGQAYAKAMALKCSVFLLIVGDQDSDELPDDQIYCKSGNIKEALKTQEVLKELAGKDRLASAGYMLKRNDFQFTSAQKKAIENWIMDYK